MQPPFSEELVERSLAAAVQLADAVIPLAMESFRFSADQVRLVPPGGVDLDEANLQALPNLFRLNLIKLVAGYNRDRLVPQIQRKGSPNNGLWLGIAGTEQMSRVYKVSKRYGVKQSGRPQERLITQERYLSQLEQPELIHFGEPILDSLLMWQSHGYEMVTAFVMIPNGWDDAGRLVEVSRREIELPDSLADVAAFRGDVEDRAVVGGGMPILVPKADAEISEDVSLLDDEESLVNPDEEQSS